MFGAQLSNSFETLATTRAAIATATSTRAAQVVGLSLGRHRISKARSARPALRFALHDRRRGGGRRPTPAPNRARRSKCTPRAHDADDKIDARRARVCEERREPRTTD